MSQGHIFRPDKGKGSYTLYLIDLAFHVSFSYTFNTNLSGSYLKPEGRHLKTTHCICEKSLAYWLPGASFHWASLRSHHILGYASSRAQTTHLQLLPFDSAFTQGP